ncbi:MAG: Fe-S cluster assembly ATPase SufC [bacterium]
MKPLLSITNLHASVESKEILRGVNLVIPRGEVHVLMGPNGSGKSSLALTLFGHPNYVVTKGSVALDGTTILHMTPDARARLGLFLSFQHPIALPGVSIAQLTRVTAKHLAGNQKVDVRTFRAQMNSVLADLQLPATFLDRSVNDGFSGGEKKQSEILQMASVAPQCIILDEPDSGLDVDALKRIANVINAMRTPERGFLLITHYQRLLEHIRPDAVHIFLDGHIVRSGGPEVAKEVEQKGYADMNEVSA